MPPPVPDPLSETSPKSRKLLPLTLGAVAAIAIGTGFWFYKDKTPPTVEPPAASVPPQAPAAVTATPEAAKPADAAPEPALAIEEKTVAAAKPQQTEKKAAPKKPVKKEAQPVHNESPAVAPPAPPPPRNSLEALRRELLECEKRNFFARPLCRERAQDRHCPDSHFNSTPECQRSGDSTLNRGG